MRNRKFIWCGLIMFLLITLNGIFVAVYMSRHRHLWKDHKVFTTSLASHSEELPDNVQDTLSKNESKQSLYGPGALGCTYELCAGIVDKNKTLEQIAADEIHEETGKSGCFYGKCDQYHNHVTTGYEVPLAKLECITSFYSSVGHAGSYQTLFYCEVTDSMKKSGGGGNVMEGEEIEVVNLPLEKSTELFFDQNKPRSTGLLLALMWFEHYKKPLYYTKTC